MNFNIRYDVSTRIETKLIFVDGDNEDKILGELNNVPTELIPNVGEFFTLNVDDENEFEYKTVIKIERYINTFDNSINHMVLITVK